MIGREDLRRRTRGRGRRECKDASDELLLVSQEKRRGFAAQSGECSRQSAPGMSPSRRLGTTLVARRLESHGSPAMCRGDEGGISLDCGSGGERATKAKLAYWLVKGIRALTTAVEVSTGEESMSTTMACGGRIGGCVAFHSRLEREAGGCARGDSVFLMGVVGLVVPGCRPSVIAGLRGRETELILHGRRRTLPAHSSSRSLPSRLPCRPAFRLRIESRCKNRVPHWLYRQGHQARAQILHDRKRNRTLGRSAS